MRIVRREAKPLPPLPNNVLSEILSQVGHQRRALLLPTLLVSRTWFKLAVSALYRDLRFTKESGRRLQKLIDCLAFSPTELVTYSHHVRSIHITQIVQDGVEITKAQPWELVLELLAKCSMYVESLYLGTGDDRFLKFEDCGLPPTIHFPNMRELSIQSHCVKFPQLFLIDLVRRSCPQTNSLKVLRLPGCLGGLDGTGWWLIAERGSGTPKGSDGSYRPKMGMEELVLTPAASSDDPAVVRAGRKWTVDTVNNGLLSLRGLGFLRKLDLSLHQTISSATVQSLLFSDAAKTLEDLNFTDCGFSDPHLLAIWEAVSQGQAPSLKRLAVGCSCLGPVQRSSFLGSSFQAVAHQQVKVKASPQFGIAPGAPVNLGWACAIGSCGRYSDLVVRRLLDAVAGRSPKGPEATSLYIESGGRKVPTGFTIVLPRFIMDMKTSKRTPTLAWSLTLPSGKQAWYDAERVMYLDVAIVIPDGRMVM
ncbi:hypothetical protein BJ742DRAFT_906463 [Cladochytrium replicatum]|nr:hypothetical protein BJ742DRAFT_906463 [Cladochytrium replicatum]